MVTVKNRDKLAGGLFQRVVDVPGFGMLMSRPGDILNPHLFGERFEFWPVTVIENVNTDLLFRPVDAQRGVDGRLHHPQIFVVGRHQQIDRRPGCAVGRHRHRLAIQRPDGLEISQHQHHPGIGFRYQQQQAAGQAERIVPVQGGGIAPPQVAAGNGQRQHDQHQSRQTARYPAHHHGNGPQQHHKHKLRRQIERLRNTEYGEDCRQYADNNKQQTAHALAHPAKALNRTLLQPGIFQPLWQGLQPLGVAQLQPPPAGETMMGYRCTIGAEHQQPQPLHQIAQRVRRPRTAGG
ncbi:hypothetical protein D3C79_410890 [compost metagenome]